MWKQWRDKHRNLEGNKNVISITTKLTNKGTALLHDKRGFPKAALQNEADSSTCTAQLRLCLCKTSWESQEVAFSEVSWLQAGQMGVFPKVPIRDSLLLLRDRVSQVGNRGQRGYNNWFPQNCKHRAKGSCPATTQHLFTLIASDVAKIPLKRWENWITKIFQNCVCQCTILISPC